MSYIVVWIGLSTGAVIATFVFDNPDVRLSRTVHAIFYQGLALFAHWFST